NVSNVTNMQNMFLGVAISISNYDALLNGWLANGVQNKVNFGAGSSRFSESGASARATLIDAFGWAIDDLGLLTLPELEDTQLTLYTNNAAIILLKNAGGFVVECVEEDLPVGFSIQVSADETTCEIIGLPVEVQTVTTFTVTA